MSRSLKVYIGILIVILIGIIMIDANRPKPIDWTPTFSIKDKIPFGLYVFNNESDAFFKPQKITQFGKSPYEFFDSKYSYIDTTYSIKGNFLYINGNFDIDEESVEELLYFAEHGNNIFLSSSDFPSIFADTLHFKMEYDNSFTDSLQMNVEFKQKKNSFYFNKGINASYFTEIDSNSKVLGTQKRSNGKVQSNFIKIPYGKGNFYLHCQPIAFTNYYLLKENQSYAADVLSNLPNENEVFWKIKRYESDGLEQSPLRFWFSQPALKSAWLLAIYGLIIFMIFNAKRKQRIIPIITPLKNTTIEFTKTIGNLYYQEKDYLNIIDKKIIFFLEKVRNDYYLDTFNLDETFCKRLQQKSGKNLQDIEKLVQLIKQLRTQSSATETDVIELNKMIELFYEH